MPNDYRPLIVRHFSLLTAAACLLWVLGCSDSDPVSVGLSRTLGRVEGFAISYDTTSMRATLRWDAVPHAVGYNVLRAESGDNLYRVNSKIHTTREYIIDLVNSFDRTNVFSVAAVDSNYEQGPLCDSVVAVRTVSRLDVSRVSCDPYSFPMMPDFHGGFYTTNRSILSRIDTTGRYVFSVNYDALAQTPNLVLVDTAGQAYVVANTMSPRSYRGSLTKYSILGSMVWTAVDSVDVATLYADGEGTLCQASVRDSTIRLARYSEATGAKLDSLKFVMHVPSDSCRSFTVAGGVTRVSRGRVLVGMSWTRMPTFERPNGSDYVTAAFDTIGTMLGAVVGSVDRAATGDTVWIYVSSCGVSSRVPFTLDLSPVPGLSDPRSQAMAADSTLDPGYYCGSLANGTTVFLGSSERMLTFFGPDAHLLGRGMLDAPVGTVIASPVMTSLLLLSRNAFGDTTMLSVRLKP